MSFERTHSAALFPDKLKSCGKNTYPDKRAVTTFLNSFKKQRGRHGRPEALRSYWCGGCGGWHVTKGKPKRKAKR